MAQNKDSIFITKPVEVEAIRHIDRNSSALTPVSIISIDELKNTGAWQVSDGLAFTPGIFIRNYGGLGGLKTVSLRGANASQTTILLNGVRLNSSQNGQFDLSTLPASFVDEIEVMRGGSSMMFGGNAIAGAINIKTQKGSEGNALTTHLSYGSFQSSLLSVSGNLPISDSLNLFAIGEFSGSKGDYSFDSEQFGEIERLQRSNGDFKNLTGLAVVQFPFLSLQWNAQGLYRATNRGTPGAVLQGRVESSNARLQEYDRLISLSADKEFSEGASLTMLLSGRGNTMVYDDPDMSFTTNKGISTFDNNEYSVRSVLRLFLSKTLAEITAEGILAELSGDNLQPGVGKYINRIQAGIGGRVEHEIHTDSLLKITLHTGIRFDHFSDRGNSVSPLLGAGFSFFKNLLIRTQWSYNFRPPTFNEMYYLNYGNALLRPEKSHSFNLGAVWQPVSFSYTEVELFLIRTSDQIAGVPKNPVQWSAQNIGLVISRGFEASVVFKNSKQWNFRNSYTFQITSDETGESYMRGKQIVYVPRHIVAGIFSCQLFTLSEQETNAGVQYQFSDERFSLPDNSEPSRIPGYLTFDAHISHSARINATSLIFRAEVINLFNEQYAIIRNFPMPGRNFRLSLRAEL